MGGGHSQQRNQPKLTFMNHSRPLNSIGYWLGINKPKCVFQTIRNATKGLLQNF